MLLAQKSKTMKGARFGKLTVLGLPFYAYKGCEKRRQFAHCVVRCDCGKVNVVMIASLNKSCRPVSSCGCVKELQGGASRTNRRLYNIWRAMIQRCHGNHRYFHRYGGRGISVCFKWRRSAVAFQRWAMTNGYENHLTIDRIDNDGDYSPANCRWVTHKQNANNRCNSLSRR